jgi:hypothetical protein
MSKENQIPSEILYLLSRKTGNDVAPLQVPRCQKFPLKSQKVQNYLPPTHPPTAPHHLSQREPNPSHH